MADGNNPEDNLCAFHFYDKQKYIERPIVGITIQDNADVAIGVLAQFRHNKTNEELQNKFMKLTLKTQAKRSTIATFAYPQNKFSNRHC